MWKSFLVLCVLACAGCDEQQPQPPVNVNVQSPPQQPPTIVRQPQVIIGGPPVYFGPYGGYYGPGPYRGPYGPYYNHGYGHPSPYGHGYGGGPHGHH